MYVVSLRGGNEKIAFYFQGQTPCCCFVVTRHVRAFEQSKLIRS